MNHDLIINTDFSRIERTLDVLSRRQEVLAANVANVDTPGYKAVDLGFDRVLDGELGKPFPLVRTSPGHFEAVLPESSEPEVVPVEGLEVRADGNNVQLERELLEMTMNRLRFDMAIRWAQGRIRALRTAINEGRG